jgi:hypothetical protein
VKDVRDIATGAAVRIISGHRVKAVRSLFVALGQDLFQWRVPSGVIVAVA